MTNNAGPQGPDEVAAMMAEVNAEVAAMPHPGQTDEQAAETDRYADWLFG